MSRRGQDGGKTHAPRRRGAAAKPRALPAAGSQRQSSAANPRIEITPTVAQYQQLCRDLKALRKSGAPSHTAAILEAVHAAAQGHMLGGDR
jgi:hypothetical protein